MMTGQKNHVDVPLLFSALTLMALSLGVVYSASATWAMQKFGESEHLLNRHTLKILIGTAALFVGMKINYPVYRRLTKPVLMIAVVLLVATLITGGEVKGASRWLRMGSFSFQPSEFAKFALLFHLCTLIANKNDLVRDFRKGFLPMMIWVGIVSLLVMLQPNLSTAMMILILSLLVLLVGRARYSHLMLAFAALVPLLLLYIVSAEYRMRRLAGFLDGSEMSTRTNYQLLQGIIGFGNGGLFGVGPGESKQRDFFLPESYGDFVFSIVGEEYGFVGTMTFLALFVVIMIRGFKIAKFSQDGFGYYLAIAVTSAITLNAIVNAGVTLGVLPTTGLPMPFVSYGGSSIVSSAFAVGVVLNISAHTGLHPRAVKVPVLGMVDASGEEVESSGGVMFGKMH